MNKILGVVCALAMVFSADLASAGQASAVATSVSDERSIHASGWASTAAGGEFNLDENASAVGTTGADGDGADSDGADGVDAADGAEVTTDDPVEGVAEDPAGELTDDLVEEPAQGAGEVVAPGSSDGAESHAPGEAPALQAEAVSAAAAPSASNLATMQAEIVRRTNDHRKANGLPALKTDSRMHSVAQTWSLQQAKADKMYHNDNVGKQIPKGWNAVGENVAWGQRSAKQVVEAWFNSPGHRANMLHNQFTHIGIGVAYTAKGRPYYTQVFAGYPNGLAKPGVFTDVSPGAPFYKEIAWMLESGLSTGVSTPAGRAYQPKNAVSREAMAAFLYRLETPKGATKPIGYTIPKTSPFADVPTNHKFYKEIAWMSKSGISTGIAQSSGKPRYNPKATVSREAMAAFLFRLEQDSGYQEPTTPQFADVRTNHKFYKQISWMYDSRLSTGVKQSSGKPKYQPSVGVSREAMAAFIYRLEHAPKG